jgi:hypothetical protein
LQEELLTNGLSLPGITISPHLADFSVGAALMTAAHGSSLVGPASIAAYIIKAILVDGTGGTFGRDWHPAQSMFAMGKLRPAMSLGYVEFQDL